MADENPPPITPRWPPPENPPPTPPVWPPPPGQQGTYYAPPSYPPSVNGALILVLGILSIVLNILCGVFGVIFGPIAWVMGNNALATIDRGQGNPTERPMVVAGRICGIIGTVLAALSVIFVVVMFAIGMLSPSGKH